MIAFLGDLHGDFYILRKVLDRLKNDYPEVVALIQVGDFGFFPRKLPELLEVNAHIPVYAIDGNHENFNLLDGISSVQEFAKNVYYVPRGTILEIDGKRIGFCGGAASVDKETRIKYGYDAWFPQEEITDADIAKFDNVESLDVLVTHVPPQCTIQAHFDPSTLKWFGLPSSWRDPSADKIEVLWRRLGEPMLFCGHMHKSVVDQMGKVRILDINELYII